MSPKKHQSRRSRSEVIEFDGATMRLCGVRWSISEHDRGVLREFAEYLRDFAEAGGLEEPFDPDWHELGEAGA